MNVLMNVCVCVCVRMCTLHVCPVVPLLTIVKKALNRNNEQNCINLVRWLLENGCPYDSKLLAPFRVRLRDTLKRVQERKKQKTK